MANEFFEKAGKTVNETNVKSSKVVEAAENKEQVQKMEDITDMFSSIYKNIKATREKFSDEDLINSLKQVDSSFEGYVENVTNMENLLSKYMDENQELTSEEVEKLQEMMSLDKEYIQNINEKRKEDKQFNKELKEIEKEKDVKLRKTSSIAEEQLEYRQKYDESQREMWESINNNIKDLSTTYVKKMSDLGGSILEGVGGPYAKLVKDSLMPMFSFLKDSPIFSNFGGVMKNVLGIDKIKRLFGKDQKEAEKFDKEANEKLEEVKQNTAKEEGKEDVPDRQEIRKRRRLETKVRVKGDEYDQREQLNTINEKQISSLESMQDMIASQNKAFQDVKENTSVLDNVRNQIVNMSEDQKEQNEDVIRSFDVLQNKFRDISEEERKEILESDEKMKEFLESNLDESQLNENKQNKSLQDIVSTMEKQEDVWEEEKKWRKKENEYYEKIASNADEGGDEDGFEMTIPALIMGLLPVLVTAVTAIWDKLPSWMTSGEKEGEDKSPFEKKMDKKIESAEVSKETFDQKGKAEDYIDEMKNIRSEYSKAKKDEDTQRMEELKGRFKDVEGQYKEAIPEEERLKEAESAKFNTDRNIVDAFESVKNFFTKSSDEKKAKEAESKAKGKSTEVESKTDDIEKETKQKEKDKEKEGTGLTAYKQPNQNNINVNNQGGTQKRANILETDTDRIGGSIKTMGSKKIKYG